MLGDEWYGNSHEALELCDAQASNVSNIWYLDDNETHKTPMNTPAVAPAKAPIIRNILRKSIG